MLNLCIFHRRYPVPSCSRKTPTIRIFRPDELPTYKAKYEIKSFSDVVVKFIKDSDEYIDFHFDVTDNNITAYRVVICSGIEGCHIPPPSYIHLAEGSRLTSLDMLTNLPVYCRNAEGSCETNVIKELLQIQYYNPKGRPPYSNSVLRFALIMRYTSNSAYQYLKNFIPLPSNSLLCKLKSQTIDTTKGLVMLRDNLLFSDDAVLMLDEMYTQQQVQYDGRDLTGCNWNFKCIKAYFALW